jgi:hypothetical protein
MPLMFQQGQAHVFQGSITPIATSVGDIWVDTNFTPGHIKTWTGTVWADSIGSTSNITVSGVSDTLENFILEAT